MAFMGLAICPKEDWGPISSRREFDFTSCFENAALFGGLNVFFVLFALINVWQLSKAREIPYREGWILRIKTVSDILACVAYCTDFS
jgi:ATP-binding cassette, subfamily C (CFTR/MRP), member 1